MKLGLKLLMAPLITAAVALGAGATYAVLDWHDGVALRQANAADLDNVKTVGQVQEQLLQVRANVFRTLTVIASMDDNKVKQARSDLAQQVEGVKRLLGAVPGNTGNDAAVAQHVSEATPLLDRYLKQCDKAIDLSGTDPNIGIGAMRAAEETYAALTTSMQALTARNDKLHTERADAADARSLRTTLTLATLMLLATTGALFTAWRLQRSVVSELRRAVNLSEDVAAGKLTDNAGSARNDEIGDLLRALGHMVGKLRDSLHTVRVATDHIGTAASEIASGNLDLSQRTEQAASRVQQSASSMEELTGTVRQTADSARTANQLASSASTVAQRGGAVVAQVVSTMDDINASSKKISDIIGTIDGIAFQTNILALNAAVEAARAGEQGRGFAVVASEVRSLAQRSAEAAREIKSLIGASVEKVESGSRLVADAGSTMTEIVASVQRVTDIIGEISAAAGEQSSGISQVNGAVADLDRMTQQNAALVEESAAAAESLQEQARRLAAVLGSFQLGDEGRHTPAQTPTRPTTAASPKTLTAAVVKKAAAPQTHTPKATPAAVAKTNTSAPTSGKAAATAVASASPVDNGDWEAF